MQNAFCHQNHYNNLAYYGQYIGTMLAVIIKSKAFSIKKLLHVLICHAAYIIIITLVYGII